MGLRSRRRRGRRTSAPLIGEWEQLLCSSFDAFLEFQAGGARDLVFRLPAGQLTPEALAPYLTDERHWEGLGVRVWDGSVLIHFTHYEVDGELTHWARSARRLAEAAAAAQRRPGRRRPVRRVPGTAQRRPGTRNRDQRPVRPRPATLKKMTPQLKKLATLLDLDRWARRHLP